MPHPRHHAGRPRPPGIAHRIHMASPFQTREKQLLLATTVAGTADSPHAVELDPSRDRRREAEHRESKMPRKQNTAQAEHPGAKH